MNLVLVGPRESYDEKEVGVEVAVIKGTYGHTRRGIFADEYNVGGTRFDQHLDELSDTDGL